MFKKILLYALPFLFVGGLLYAANPGMRVRDPLLETAIPSTNVEGVSKRSTINKFSRNIEIDQNITADVWDGGHTGDESLLWVGTGTAALLDIVSDSGTDTAAGIGAKTIRIFGLVDWDTAEVSEDITMNGTTDVTTTNTYVIINRMEVLTAGSLIEANGPNWGIITAEVDASTLVLSKIRAAQGQTQQSIFGIASTQTLYLYEIYGCANKAGGAAGLVDVSLLVNSEPDTELTNFLVKQTFGLQTVGSSHVMHKFSVPKRIDGPAIIKIQVLSGTNNMDISAGFNGVIIDD